MPDDINPFAKYDPANANTDATTPAPVAPADQTNPFAKYAPAIDGTTDEEPSAIGTFGRAAARGVAPAAGGLAGVGPGAELGAALGAAVPGLGETGISEAVGGLIGGIGGAFAGGAAVNKAQDWALSKLPDSWQEVLGQSDRQQRLDATTHGTAAFLGGLTPYVLTMRPGGLGASAAKLPANATALQRILANPTTARLFGGGIQGGMEAGEEAADGENPDWAHIAIATGFGLVFNKPTRLGEAIENLGARPTRALLGRGEPEAPTIAQAGDAKVLGPGMTESVFQGTHEPDPATAMTAQDAVRTEDAILRPEAAQPDIHGLARRIDPDTFAAYDDLSARRDTFRDWLNELSNPSDETVGALTAQQQELQTSLEGEKNRAEQRRLRAQIRDVQSQIDDATQRREGYAAGEGIADTPEMALVRQRLQDVDYQMRDLAPNVSAAYRRANEMIGNGEELPPAPVAATEPEPGAPAPEKTTEVPGVPIEAQKASIASDVSQKLVAAGRPQEEANASGQLLADYYETRASRFEGVQPQDLYAAEGPQIKAGEQKARAKEFAQTPPDELAQEAKGKIRINQARSTITLFKSADASTFIHETGHQFLEDLVRDAGAEGSKPQVKTDAETTRAYLGNKGGELTRGQHEKFARSFEQYMREGVAPSKGLANVFAQFRGWLTKIYQTVSKLGAPINEDIRQVFDRMLSTNPERTVIAPERPKVASLADIHEADARETEPHEAEPAMDRVSTEATRYEEQQPPEVRNEIAAAEAKAAAPAEPAGEGTGGAGPGAEVPIDRAEPGTEPAGGGGGAELGKVVDSGGNAGAEGDGLSGQPDRNVAGANLRPDGNAPGPNTILPRSESRLVDKAGNIRIENLTTKEDVARAIREAAEENDDFIGDRRGVVTDGQVLDLAEALGMTPEQLSRRNIGQAFNAEQIVAARKLLIDSATQVGEAMNKADGGTDADVMAYAEAKDRHQMIQAQVAGITAEAGRALRAFRSLVGQEAAEGINEFIKKATGKTLFQLREEIRLGKELDTPAKISKFMQDAQKRTFGRMVLEYWINGLISGPATHTTYMVGNTMLILEKAGPETALAAGIGSLRAALPKRFGGREGERVHVGEVGAQLKGFFGSLPAATEASLEALRSGVTTTLPGEDARPQIPFAGDNQLVAGRSIENTPVSWHDVGSQAFGMLRGMRDALVANGALLAAGGIEGAPLIGAKYSPLGYIPDVAIRGVNVLPVGTLARAPSRAIAAIHSFYRTLNFSMEKAAIAYRTASEEGLTGNDFAARVADIRSNPSQDVMDRSAGVANQLTLMSKGSEFTQALSRLTNTEVFGFPILKFIDPFVHIASNVIDQSLLQRTPIGWLAPEVRADLLGKNGNVAQDMAIARMAVGTVLSITFGGLAAQGLASGSGPADPKQAAMWRLAGNQAHSVRVGDIWYDVHRLGPLGMLMGVAADMYDVAHAMNKEDASDVGKSIMHAFTQNILDESFMRGPAELIQAIEDPDRYGSSYVRSFLSSFTPYSVGMAQMARASDPYSRQARTIMDAVRAKIPGMSESLLPRRDIWGEPMPNREALIASGLTAIYESKMSTDPVNVAMVNLGIGPAQPERKIRNVQLTDQEYDDYSRLAGRMTKGRLDVIVRSPDFVRWPVSTQHDVIEQVIRECREVSRGVIMAKYPHIARDATVAKLAHFNNPAPEQ